MDLNSLVLLTTCLTLVLGLDFTNGQIKNRAFVSKARAEYIRVRNIEYILEKISQMIMIQSKGFFRENVKLTSKR